MAADISKRSTVVFSTHLFHLVRDHPFIDGNKRVGLMALLAFLGLNPRWLDAEPREVEKLVLGVAAGETSKADVAVFVQRHNAVAGPVVWRRGPVRS